MTNEQHLKEAVSKMITIDFNDKSWWISWWMLLDPEPSFKAILSAMDAAREDEAGKMPTVDEAGVIAAGLSEHLTAREQAFFIAGFQECIKYLKHKNEAK